MWYLNALGPAEKNETTFMCGPVKLIKNQYSVPVQWVKLVELTDVSQSVRQYRIL